MKGLAIESLRAMLDTEHEPIDRHYMMSELESRLYRKRDEFASALDEYDVVCRQHDAEMDTIRPALSPQVRRCPRDRHVPTVSHQMAEGTGPGEARV